MMNSLFHALFNNMSETFGVVEVVFDARGEWVDCLLREANPAFERASGLKRDQFINRSVRDFMRDTPDLETYLAIYARVARTGQAEHFKASYPPQNLFFHVSAFPLGDRRVGVLSVNVSEQVQAENKLRELSAQLIRAEEKERARIADILHEDLQQILVAAQYALSGIEKLPPDELARTARQLTEMLAKAVENSRLVATALRPPALYELGVGAALFWLAEEMKRTQGLTVDLNVAAAAEPATIDERIFVFQTIRELLLNVIKHAGVKEAQVRMERDAGGMIRITVSDRGRGYSEPERIRPGFGLFSIRERAGLLGGRLEMETRPGEGTRVSLILPP